MNDLQIMGEYQRLTISHSWQQCRFLLSMLEDHLDEDLQDWDEHKEKVIQELKGGKREIPKWALDFIRFAPPLRPALINSHFCSSYALFEAQITWLCKIAQSNHNILFSLNDLKGSLTERLKNYLRKLGIEFPIGASKWSEIRCYQEIRNKIIHTGAVVDSNWNHFKYVQGEGIFETNTGQLALTGPFCKRAIKSLEQFVLTVSDSIARDAYGRARETLNKP